MGGFVRDAPKTENGFIFGENCFVAIGTTKHSAKIPNHFSLLSPTSKAA
ncbi:hypothetical protein [Bradyrhizobium sp. CCH5-F6]|jgi:hypothetical protein|nr:hypothetical protein [Bradyrhizobium sp. CCH5-F6]